MITSVNSIQISYDLPGSKESFLPESDHESSVKDEADALPLMCLDAGSLGDIPARYTIPSLPNHEFPVVGVFVDPRVVPGFKYKVRVLPDLDAPQKTSYLFNGRGLSLLSIGRGYSRRLTFEADQNTTLNDNDNYFWSDSQMDGFGFELQVIGVGDKFTIHDPSHSIVGTCEIISVQGPQEEVAHTVLADTTIEKRAKVKAMCKVEWFDDSAPAVLLPMSGIAICVKKKKATTAFLIRISSVSITKEHKRGFTLTPGVKSNWRRTTVNGALINDIPAKYTITGLKHFELPVIGTYVDPRIVPGFRYKVRLAASNKNLFNARALRLTSVGIGYAKRLTFEPDEDDLNNSQNHFWSDSNPDGYGFEPIAVDASMTFTIHAGSQIIGSAEIFRADAPQQEIDQEIETTRNGPRVIKYIDVDVTCHVTLDPLNAKEKVMRVTGTAVLVKDPKEKWARLVRIENIGLDSQINLLFIREHEELVFVPK